VGAAKPRIVLPMFLAEEQSDIFIVTGFLLRRTLVRPFHRDLCVRLFHHDFFQLPSIALVAY
jgi:hypothetical protein